MCIRDRLPADGRWKAGAGRSRATLHSMITAGLHRFAVKCVSLAPPGVRHPSARVASSILPDWCGAAGF
eukprot:12777766-Alexandrium_andersonii.AAC.1